MKLVICPFVTEAVAGVMAMAVNAGAVTVKVALLEVMPLAEAVTVVLPCANVEAIPLSLSVATVALLDSQATDPETLPELPSEKVPVAVKVTGVPRDEDGAAGLMLIPVITAAVTNRLAAGEVIPLEDAVTLVLPTAPPLATPVVLLIVATPVLPDAQVVWPEMSAVVPLA